MALVRCFQLAFSLRNFSLNQDGKLKTVVKKITYLCSLDIMNGPHLFPFTMMNIVPLDYAMPFLLICDVIFYW